MVNLDLFALNVDILLNKMTNYWGRFIRSMDQELLIEIESSFGSMPVISYIPNFHVWLFPLQCSAISSQSMKTEYHVQDI